MRVPGGPQTLASLAPKAKARIERQSSRLQTHADWGYVYVAVRDVDALSADGESIDPYRQTPVAFLSASDEGTYSSALWFHEYGQQAKPRVQINGTELMRQGEAEVEGTKPNRAAHKAAATELAQLKKAN